MSALSRLILSVVCLAVTTGCATSPAGAVEQDSAERAGGAHTAASSAGVDLPTLQNQVRNTELAFARTMADRDHAAFTTFLADEAIFFSGPEALRGKAAVAAAWAPFYEGTDAPFSWEPDQVEVVDSGTLALSTGPVYDPDGNVIARFQSIWRREPSGAWRIVFDRGTPECPPSE